MSSLKPPSDIVNAGANATAAIELAKLAQRLPALLVADVTSNAANTGTLMRAGADAIYKFRRMAIDSLAVAAEADVPLNGALSARFVIFRDAIGGSSTAVIVGDPDKTAPVPLRLHSACLTGDVFGSRRCDCGDQLRIALGVSKTKAAASSSIWSRKAAASGLPTRCAPTRFRMKGSIRSTPTRCSASTTTSATMASP